MKLGFSGSLTRSFITSPLTPLLLIASLLVGAIALTALPREEEPQISVPMVDIVIMANGYKAADAVELITRPLEDIVKGIDGTEHVYSNTLDDRVVVTARFVVGTDQDTAILRVHEKFELISQAYPLAFLSPSSLDVALMTLQRLSSQFQQYPNRLIIGRQTRFTKSRKSFNMSSQKSIMLARLISSVVIKIRYVSSLIQSVCHSMV